MSAARSLVSVRGLGRVFDVSKPWLNRMIERLPRRLLLAVSDVSFDIPARTTYALVGESGSGKSTIGKMVVGLLRPTQGRVEIGGVDLFAPNDAETTRRVRSDIQMIFQDPFASLNPRWRVRDIIAEPVAARGGDTAGLAERLLGQVGLSAEDAGKYPHQFSGGQRQRICIARALACAPELIVADEAVSALDVSVQAQVINLMMDLQARRGLAYLFISHDMAVVERISHRVAVMYLGQIVEIGTRRQIFETPQHPYTRRLLAAVPVLDPDRRPDRPDMTDDIPTPIRRVGDPPEHHPLIEVAAGHLLAANHETFDATMGRTT